MANVKLSSYLQSVSGRLGKFVFFNRHGREYARLYVKPVNPDTESQKFVRKTFGSAVKSWQELPLPEKEKYNTKARRLAMSGYNLYISRFMKDNISRQDTSTGEKNTFMDYSKHPRKTMKAYSSVPSPYILQPSSGHVKMHASRCTGVG